MSQSLPTATCCPKVLFAQQAFQQMAMAALLIDAQGQLVEVNDAFCQTFGYRQADLVNHLFTTLVPLAHLSAEVQEHLVFFAHPPARPLSRVLHLLNRDQQALQAEVLECKVGGAEEFYRLLLIQSLPDRHHSGAGETNQETQGLLQEVDSLRDQIAKLQDQLQIKDSFLATAAHELRTPMTNIKMVAQMLKSCSHPHKQSTYVRILEQECEREIDLISDLLELQSLATDSTPVLELLPIQTWIRSLVEPFQILAQSRHHQLQLQFSPQLQTVMLDRKLLQRILWELLTNATKYTPAQGQIQISALPHPQDSTRWQLQVTNPLAHPLASPCLNRLFEPFYRDPNTSGQTGTGLGLALVQQAVQTLGGSISVQALGHQLSFRVDLPLQLPS